MCLMTTGALVVEMLLSIDLEGKRGSAVGILFSNVMPRLDITCACISD